MADQAERRSCLALSLRGAYHVTTPGTGGRYSVKWREMGGRVATSWTRGEPALAKAMMALCRYLGFFNLSGAERPSRLKKRYGWEVILPHATKVARCGEKIQTDLGRRAVAGFISGVEQMSLRPARRPWWRTSISSGGRQASLCKHVRLVEEKQLVIHLQTRCQKTDIGPMIDGGGFQTADPYRRIGARSECAKERQR